MSEGVDYSFGRPNLTALKRAGKTFACRYLYAAGKGITGAEYRSLVATGFDVVLNYESSAGAATGGRAAGVKAAQAAEAYRKAAGIPVAPIYFSVDWDATPGQQTVINAFLDGVASVIGRARTGMYGGYWPLSRAFDAGKVTWGWQTYAWSGGNLDSRAHLYQYSNNVMVAGAAVDLDRSRFADFGQVGYVSPVVPSSPTSTHQGDDVKIIQQRFNDNQKIDGTLRYLRWGGDKNYVTVATGPCTIIAGAVYLRVQNTAGGGSGAMYQVVCVVDTVSADGTKVLNSASLGTDEFIPSAGSSMHLSPVPPLILAKGQRLRVKTFATNGLTGDVAMSTFRGTVQS